MDPERAQFDDLRRLLALKRHEVPPPGFFEAFPDRVRARILAESRAPAAPWWARWVARPGWRPALAGACAVLAGGLLIWQFGARPGGTVAPTQFPADAAAPARWAESSLTPATASGALPDGSLAGRPAGSPSWMNPWPANAAPPGLFAPGAGLRGALTPAAATSHAPAVTVTGLNLGTPPLR
jgi:hypothetical protein